MKNKRANPILALPTTKITEKGQIRSDFKEEESDEENYRKVPERVSSEKPMGFQQLKTFSEVSREQQEGNEYIVNQMVNYYAFEAQMKDRVIDLIKPVMIKQLEDEETNKTIAYSFNKLSERLEQVESCFNLHKGKNAIFDLILERLSDDEAWSKQTQHDNVKRMNFLQEQVTAQTKCISGIKDVSDIVKDQTDNMRVEVTKLTELVVNSDKQIIQE